MAANPSNDAWNKFVTLSEPAAHDTGSEKRSAAIAAQYMGLANNGGINSFLTSSYDLDAREVLESLVAIGASVAAKELGLILSKFGAPIPRASQEARWHLLERYWTPALDAYDVLSEAADRDLMQALSLHVQQNEAFYLELSEASRR